MAGARLYQRDGSKQRHGECGDISESLIRLEIYVVNGVKMANGKTQSSGNKWSGSNPGG